MLLNAAESKLISDAVFTSNTCFMSLNPDQSVFQPSDQYAIITPGPQRLDKGLMVGAGENLIYFNGTFTVTIWSRLALDQTAHDDSYLTDASYGAIILMTKVIQSLHLYQPLDGSGNQLVAVPFSLDSIDSYKRDFKGVGWGALVLKMNMEWQMTS